METGFDLPHIETIIDKPIVILCNEVDKENKILKDTGYKIYTSELMAEGVVNFVNQGYIEKYRKILYIK